MAKLFAAFPPDWRLKSVLVQGGVFQMWHEYGTEDPPGERRRFFFIVNKDAWDAETILVVTTTLQGKKRKERHGPDTVVDVTKAEYTELPYDSAVDCNYIKVFCRQKLIDRINEGKWNPLKPLSRKVLEKILSAIRQSRLVARDQKRLILPD